MPYLISKNVRIKNNLYQLYYIDDVITKFPFLENKTIDGKVISVFIDGTKTKINKDFSCTTSKEANGYIATIEEPNPLEEKGIPQCEALVLFTKYHKIVEGGDYNPLEDEEGYIERPIMEEKLLISDVSYNFQDEAQRLRKEEEIGIILESIVFHYDVTSLASQLKNALSSFEKENFQDTKTSCRKILEKLRPLVKNWESIDESKSLGEKFKRTLDSLYSFASVGGPHTGVKTKEESDLILKVTFAILLYVNSILKNSRYKSKST